MFRRIWEYLSGNVRIQIDGYDPERFLNLCKNKGITLQDLTYENGFYQCKISVSDFFQLKPILKKSRTKVLVLKREGMPFVFFRYRKHKGFLPGMLLCCFVMFFMSHFIWDIQVEGNSYCTDEAIKEYLEEEHIALGTRKSALDCEDIERMLRSRYEKIIWASARVDGTRLTVTVQESLKLPEGKEQVEKDAYDLVAETDGRVSSMVTRAGTPLVKVGDVVQKGEVLISGAIPLYNDSGELTGYEYTAADGTILLETVREYEDTLKMQGERKAFQEEKWFSCSVDIKGKQYGISLDFLKKKQMDIRKERKQVVLFEKLGLPVYITSGFLQPYVKEPFTYTFQEATLILQTNCKEFCTKLEEKGIQIVENNVIIYEGNSVCRASGTITALEPVEAYQETERVQLPEVLDSDSERQTEEE